MTNMTPEEAIKQIAKHFDGRYPGASEQEKFDFVLAIINQQRQQAVAEARLERGIDAYAEMYSKLVEENTQLSEALRARGPERTGYRLKLAISALELFACPEPPKQIAVLTELPHITQRGPEEHLPVSRMAAHEYVRTVLDQIQGEVQDAQ